MDTVEGGSVVLGSSMSSMLIQQSFGSYNSGVKCYMVNVTVNDAVNLQFHMKGYNGPLP